MIGLKAYFSKSLLKEAAGDNQQSPHPGVNAWAREKYLPSLVADKPTGCSPNLRRGILALVALSVLAFAAHAQPRITIDHNPNPTATGAFKFKNVPSPAKDDAAAKAKLLIIDGDVDGNGADIGALVDGMLPTDPDQPGKNFFFNAGTGGGRWRMDLGRVIEIAQINTYSWHPNTRGPQFYQVWASDGADPKFNAQPRANIDPTKCGWKLIAVVDTRSSDDDGGQFGVSISDARGGLGKFRYLLFDCYATETFDESGNTFYSEVDVISGKVPDGPGHTS